MTSDWMKPKLYPGYTYNLEIDRNRLEEIQSVTTRTWKLIAIVQRISRITIEKTTKEANHNSKFREFLLLKWRRKVPHGSETIKRK